MCIVTVTALWPVRSPAGHRREVKAAFYSQPSTGGYGARSVGCQWDHISPELAGRVILILLPVCGVPVGPSFTRVSWPGYSHPTAGSVGCQWDHTSPELAGRVILTLRQSSCSAGSVLLKWNRAAL